MCMNKLVVKNNAQFIRFLLIIVFSIFLHACGGGSGGGGGSVLPKQTLIIDIDNSEFPVGEKTTYQAILVNENQEEQPVVVECTSSDEAIAKIDANGITGLGAGEVTITCGFGTLSVEITLTILSRPYPIQVAVSGLVSAATTLILQNNGQDNLIVSQNGVNNFDTSIANGEAYHVSVLQQPADPDQVCTVENASGNVGDAVVTNIVVTCAGVSGYSIGGSVSGLKGKGLILALANEIKVINADGNFTFNTLLTDGNDYSVSISQQPSQPTQLCDISQAEGTVASANVTDITISCELPPPILTSIGFDSLQSELRINDVLQLTVTGHYSDASETELIENLTWSSDLATIVEVNSQGQIKGIALGEATVTASYNEFNTSKTFTVVSDAVNLAPTVTSDNNINVAENSEGAFLTITATDPESDTLVFTIKGGDDAEQFSLDQTSGLLTWQKTADFEQPNDADADNIYKLEIEVSDTDKQDQQILTIHVTDVIDTSPTDAPTNLSVIATTDTLTLHWDTVANTEQYLVYWADNTTPDLTTITPETITDTQFTLEGDLSEASAYHFIVVAQNSVGLGPISIDISGKLIAIPPTVVAHVPSANATDISINFAAITASFSEALTPISVNDTSFMVRIQGGDAITGTLSYTGTRASFTPSEPLSYATIYEVALLTSLTDVAGNALPENVSWSFTTGAEPAIPMFSIGGSANKLAGTGLVLLLNGEHELSIDENGEFNFPVKIKGNDLYSVSVKQQPNKPSQNCTVERANGTVTADITDILVVCTTIEFSIGGTVIDLTGTGLELQLNGEAIIGLAKEDSTFKFPGSLPDGSAFTINIITQPTELTQVCQFSNNATEIKSKVAGEDVNLSMSCVTNKYAVSGMISGLAGTGLTLQLNEGESIDVPKGIASFAFSTALVDGSDYAVTITNQPKKLSQTCGVKQSSQTISGGAIADVSVTCQTNQYSIGGAVEGLVADNLVLQLNGAHNLLIDKAAKSFEFSQKLDDQSGYLVTIKTQPNDQLCDLSNPIGILTGSPITNIIVSCIVQPDPPSGLTVSSVEDAMTLGWEAVANAEIYHIYRREDANTPVDSDRVTEANGVTDLLFTDANALQAGKTYQYWVSAGNKAGFSTITKFPNTVQLKPAAPLWTSVDSCDNKVYLRWQKIAGYHYVIKEGSDVLTEGDINEYTTGELTVGSAHTYHLEVTYLSGIDGVKVITATEEKTLTVSDALCTPIMITVPIMKDGVKKNILIPMF